MDPYATLGISRYATEDELKKAFRKEAMKWHPDRVGTSQQASDRFLQISKAYQVLSRELRNKRKSKDSHANQSTDSVSSDIFSNDLFNYAVRLIDLGYTQNEIAARLAKKGCDAELASVFAAQAYKAQNGFSDAKSGASKNNDQQHGFAARKFDYVSLEALLGEKKQHRANRRKISYYLDTFNDLNDRVEEGKLLLISKNPYLSKVFNRALILLLLIVSVTHFFPVVYRLQPLGLLDLLQIPNMVLSLILVWAVYRKLWVLFTIALSMFAATQVYFYHEIPVALEQGMGSIILTSIVYLLPFVILTRSANFLFYLKARNILESVHARYPELEDKQLILRNHAGVSTHSALLITILLVLYFMQMVPENGSLYTKYLWLFPQRQQVVNKDFSKIEEQSSETMRLFEMAEQAFNQNPANLDLATTLYAQAADSGSLLAAYKLGYLYLAGVGVEQNDQKAFSYFYRAVHAPIALQPHKLSLVTQWLAEAYKGLGILYLAGYGTKVDRHKAATMFRQAIKYGPPQGMRGLLNRNSLSRRELLTLVTVPDYAQ